MVLLVETFSSSFSLTTQLCVFLWIAAFIVIAASRLASNMIVAALLSFWSLDLQLSSLGHSRSLVVTVKIGAVLVRRCPELWILPLAVLR